METIVEKTADARAFAPTAPELLPTPGDAFNRRHVLDLDDFTAEEILAVLETTDRMKEVLSRPIKKVPALRGVTVVNLFYEASTRTRISFELAAKNLSADVVNVASATSSVTKGESLVDTVRTLKALYADVIVVRHPEAGAPYLIAEHFDGSVINGGDGCHAHPTQALLDLYTMRERLGRIDDLKVVIVGDVRHSRVARSNAWSLSTMGCQVVFCGPPTLLPVREVEFDKLWNGRVSLDHNLDRAIEDADVVMALRLQKERQQSGLLPSLREYTQLWGLTKERVARAKPGALVMHPGPMNEGVEIMPDVATSVQSVIQEQVTNGVAVRMALLYLLAGGER
jgi:aspartate carbamoyltransferase catalytic subunit